MCKKILRKVKCMHLCMDALDDASLLSKMDLGVRPVIALDPKLPKLSAKEQRQAAAFVALM
jgi:hypothetical protein